jgi:hypothetical protein
VDFAKFDRPPLLHLGFRALHKFKAAKGFFPRPANAVSSCVSQHFVFHF